MKCLVSAALLSLAQAPPGLAQAGGAAQNLRELFKPQPPVITIAEAVKACEKPQAVRVRGIFTGETAPGVLYMQDATAPIRVWLNKPLAAEPGAEIEVTGTAKMISSRAAQSYPGILDAAAEPAGPGGLPVAEPFDPAAAYASEERRAHWFSRYVNLRGTITGFGENTATWTTSLGKFSVPRETMDLEAGGRRVKVLIKTGSGLKKKYQPGTEVEVAGVCRLAASLPADGQSGPIELLTHSAAQVRMAAPPPFWARREVQQGLRYGILGFIALLAVGTTWILGQRRRLKALRASEEKYRALSQSLEQRVAERTAELDVALAREREIGQLKTNFVSLVSHEFRTPLGGIMAAVEVLRGYFDRLPKEKRQEQLDIIFRSTKNLAGLIEEVLLLGRMEDGRLSLTRTPLDLAAFCRALTDELRSATGGVCPIELHADGTLAGACADEAALRHILSNLISNAVKYSEPGQPVTVSAAREGTAVVFTIADRGIGIPPEDQPRLFETFTRGSNVGNRPGTGLGLVIVQRCVHLHEGALQLKSTPGEGTEVTVTLPGTFAES